jgi:hypothetical protein
LIDKNVASPKLLRQIDNTYRIPNSDLREVKLNKKTYYFRVFYSHHALVNELQFASPLELFDIH